ncbi:MAG: hypothetical protein ACW98X_07475 [Promethearchaeota archaeon]
MIEEKGGKASPREIPNIWRVHPSYVHTNSTVSLFRIIILIGMATFLIMATYLLGVPLPYAIGIGSVIIGGFIVLFYGYINTITYIFSSKAKINLFDKLLTYWEKNDQTTLFIANTKDLVHTALQIFRIEEIPENIHASLNLFIKSLSEYKNMIKFTYQVVQTPTTYMTRTSGSGEIEVKDTGSRSTNIYFCVYFSLNGFISRHKIKVFHQKLRYAGNTLRNNFIGNFHHFKISRLSGDRLVNALRTYFFYDFY